MEGLSGYRGSIRKGCPKEVALDLRAEGGEEGWLGDGDGGE